MSEQQLHEVALTEEEKDTILSYCGSEPVLVGGQALAFWALWFKIQSPAELGDKITTDADFIGSRTNAAALNKQLHWTMWKPSFEDATPQTAKLTKRVENNGVKQKSPRDESRRSFGHHFFQWLGGLAHSVIRARSGVLWASRP